LSHNYITCFGGAACCCVITLAVGEDNNLTFFDSSAALAPSILSRTCFFCKKNGEFYHIDCSLIIISLLVLLVFGFDFHMKTLRNICFIIFNHIFATS